MKLLVWFGTSDGARRLYDVGAAVLVPAGLVLQEMSLGFHENFPWLPQWSSLYLGMIGVGVLLSITVVLMRFVFRRLYSMNQLFYEKRTGILYDRWLKEHNVALRRRTVQRLIRGIEEDSQGNTRRVLLHGIAYDIGSDFVRTFETKARPGGVSVNGRPLLEKILQYDSSSGMGNFTLTRYAEEPAELIIRVDNPFTEEESSEVASEFLKGYFSGVCSEIMGKKHMTAECKDIGARRVEITLAG